MNDNPSDVLGIPDEDNAFTIFSRSLDEYSDDEPDFNVPKVNHSDHAEIENVGDGNRFEDNASGVKPISAHLMQKEHGFAAKVNFSVFNDKGVNCQSTQIVGGGIVSQCDSLRRLIEGLSCYDAMKEDPDSLMDFIANQYREQMIDDFNHFVAEHEHQSDEIMKEMTALHHFKQCDVEHCAHSKRHFDQSPKVIASKYFQDGLDEAAELLTFYSSKYDALHFALFHLFETGYRYRFPPRPHKHNEDDDEKMAQQELAAAVSAIKTGRDRCRGALGRFESESNNKFNLSVSIGAESKTEDGHSVKTAIDSMMKYVASMPSNGVGQDALVQINRFMVREDIDTDAAKDDVAESKEESNLFAVTKSKDVFHAVKRYFTRSAGMQ